VVLPKLVVGLGNPGPKYEGTRHNVGFDVVDALSKGGRWKSLGWWSRLCWYTTIGSGLILAKPRTFMNHSGQAVVSLCRRFDITPESLLVVYDDADLELGRLRLRKSGGSGGHNGLRSIAELLGTAEFLRLRLGVRGEGRAQRPLAEYVLDRFTEEETPRAGDLVATAVESIREMERNGFEIAMNRYNARSAAPRLSARSAEEEG